jgi:ectoine hydroxylase-related dioxygenase (phytanoyl-CoA dioxygenase family)
MEWKALVGRRKSRIRHSVTFLNDISNATQGRGLEIIHSFICRIRNFSTKKLQQRIDYIETPAGHRINMENIDAIVSELRQVGFSKLPNFMNPSDTKSLNNEITKMAGRSTPPIVDYASQDEWQRDASSGPRYTVRTELIARSEVCREIAVNSVICEVAGQYLGCDPLLASTQVWTTRPPTTFSPDVLSEAAMAFHCDSDYFGFLKFFVLLTDVAEKNGPFTFVGGSHRGKRHVAGRMNDSEIISDDDVVYYGTGQAGDLIIVDSKGWHKASPPRIGYRTMLQVVYSSSLFGFPT